LSKNITNHTIRTFLYQNSYIDIEHLFDIITIGTFNKLGGAKFLKRKGGR